MKRLANKVPLEFEIMSPFSDISWSSTHNFEEGCHKVFVGYKLILFVIQGRIQHFITFGNLLLVEKEQHQEKKEKNKTDIF